MLIIGITVETVDTLFSNKSNLQLKKQQDDTTIASVTRFSLSAVDFLSLILSRRTIFSRLYKLEWLLKCLACVHVPDSAWKWIIHWVKGGKRP